MDIKTRLRCVGALSPPFPERQGVHRPKGRQDGSSAAQQMASDERLVAASKLATRKKVAPKDVMLATIESGCAVNAQELRSG
jgi:hypothetical protein